MNSHYPFELVPLPYPYNALEPYISSQTMTLHHDKHLKTYVDNLNKALEKYPAYHNWPLRRLIRENCRLPFQIQAAVWNNAGGVYNHNLFFSILGMPEKKEQGKLENALAAAYGSIENFKEKFKACALSQFGSGYAWLVSDCRGKLKILSTLNQDTPLPYCYCPILLVDVWEHSYYLQYQNRRGEYLDRFFHVLNWDAVEQNYLNCIKSGRKSSMQQFRF